jgi:two-component system, sensor histidine kinase and response regulator
MEMTHPAASGQSDQQQSAFAVESPKPVNILLVDDEPKNLMALEAVLDSLGQNLVTARSGDEALRCLIQQEFAVILLDVQMVGMNGFETATLIRQRDRSRHTPIIFLTAVGKTDTDIFQGYAVGAIDYMVKPFVPTVLRSKVSVLIDLYRKTEQVTQLNRELNRRAKEQETLNVMLKSENDMRKRTEEDLRQSEEILKNLNATLEARVLERTASVEEHSRKLTQSNNDLERFAYASSHDLQEPLRTMMNYLQLLEQDSRDELNEESKGYIKVAIQCGRRMRDLINGLLEYSRLTGKEHQFTDVDCDLLLKEVLQQLEGSISGKVAEIEHTALPHVFGEALLLRQLFQNLISNALKFYEKKPLQIQVGSQKQGREWLFWVKDNGIGIEPRFFGKIFELFQRLHTREEYPGAGLGLSVCKKTVELHGGRIWCESELGKGTCFYFTIPLGEAL